MNHVTKEVSQGNSDFFSIRSQEYSRFIVLSLGTGTAKEEGKYDAEQAAKWGILGWLTSGGSTPLVDVFSQASSDMVDFHLSTIFQTLQSEENYLRIQVPTFLSLSLSLSLSFGFLFLLTYIKMRKPFAASFQSSSIV